MELLSLLSEFITIFFILAPMVGLLCYLGFNCLYEERRKNNSLIACNKAAIEFYRLASDDIKDVVKS